MAMHENHVPPSPLTAQNTRNAPGRPSERVVCALLFVCSFSLYNSNLREISEDDTIATRFLPVSLVTEFDLTLDEFLFLYEGRDKPPYYLARVNGHYVSTSPIMPAILASPFYAPVLATGMIKRGGVDFFYDVSFLSKVVASVFAAASVVLVFVTLRRLTALKPSLVFTVAYAFGTNTWAVSSQGMWQHAPAQLFLALTVCLLLQSASRPSLVAWAGLSAGLALACRPAAIVFVVVLIAYVLHKRTKAAPFFILLFLVPMVPVAAYNLHYFGALQGGYGKLTSEHVRLGQIAHPWSGSFFAGLAGHLFSPNRGLFVFTPFTLFAFVGMASAWRRQVDPLFRYLSLAILLTLAVGCKFFSWWAGWSFGPRYLTDVLPALCLFLVFVDGLTDMRRLALPFGVTVVFSICVQAIGAFCYPSGWNWSPENVDLRPNRLWDWRDTELRRCLERGVRPTFFGEKAEAHLEQSLRQFGAGNFAEAKREAQIALRLRPHNPQSHNALGNACLRLGQVHEARDAYQTAVRLLPTYAQAHCNLGSTLLILKQYEHAIPALAHAARLDPGLVPAYQNLGLAYRMLGLRERAIEMYKMVVHLAPEDAESQRVLAELQAPEAAPTQ
ncbi:MAG: tetratricopeptide repeat protein [Planctomycetes bacterium]|nr:tetratricopeptide repeat protein [Planctomycetota bacterium]